MSAQAQAKVELVDYSQNGEQGAILAAFEGRKPGRFLDIGAWHPKRLSNTRALFECGWSGVMVEPSPYPMRNLLDEYGNDPRVTLVQACVVHNTGQTVEMFISDDAFSTNVAEQYQKWKGGIRFIGKILVCGLTLGQLEHNFGQFDFVDIDAEGTSADLFMDLLRSLSRPRPRCVCVEHDGRQNELCAAAENAGYALTFQNDVNLIFVQKETA